MPTYEYECDKCGKTFELIQRITEPPRKKLRSGDPKPCRCNATVSRRISTGGGLIFKGSGFYLTDYRSESYKKAVEAEKGGGQAKEKESQSSVTKADSKPADSTAASSTTKSARKKSKSKE